jgi:hypothetical protein
MKSKVFVQTDEDGVVEVMFRTNDRTAVINAPPAVINNLEEVTEAEQEIVTAGRSRKLKGKWVKMTKKEQEAWQGSKKEQPNPYQAPLEPIDNLKTTDKKDTIKPREEGT